MDEGHIEGGEPGEGSGVEEDCKPPGGAMSINAVQASVLKSYSRAGLYVCNFVSCVLEVEKCFGSGGLCVRGLVMKCFGKIFVGCDLEIGKCFGGKWL
jgi:hypothetical protein